MFLKVWDIVHWRYILVSHWNKTVFYSLSEYKYCGPYRGDRYETLILMICHFLEMFYVTE